jgi:hypothetical protein
LRSIDPRVRTLYLISLAAYIVSFGLPAVINPHPTPGFPRVETWGWQAALMSVLPPMLVVTGESNLGYVLAALLVPAGWYRAAVASSLVSLLSMAYCGVALPERAGDLIRFPGGHLGPGYYVWLGAGVVMFGSATRGLSAPRTLD